jgi:hypothetical protein
MVNASGDARRFYSSAEPAEHDRQRISGGDIQGLVLRQFKTQKFEHSNMKRRYFNAGMGIGALTLAAGANPTPAAFGRWVGDPKIGGTDGGHRGTKFCCRVIGVGGAGCNLLAAMRVNGAFDGYGPGTELIAVDLCPDTLWHVVASNKTVPERASIKTLAIGECGSGGRVNAGRAAALRHHDQLNGLMSGADVVILVAGLGGGTGSGVTPILAAWSRNAGVSTVVAAVTPFDFGGSIKQSANAMDLLHRTAAQVIHFSNQAVAVELGDEATLGDVFAVQEHRISSWVQGLNLG